MARFGNWSVNAFKIEWKGDSDFEFSISIPEIVATGTHESCILYQWLIEVASDNRLSTEDIYSLNTAFFYAMDIFSAELEIPSHALLAETLKAQQQILDKRKSACLVSNEKFARDQSTWYGKLYKL